jgi:hypothetical protein
MTELGADYSWARPGGAALAAAGVKAVGRYLANDGRGITAPEYQDLTAHGIGVWLCREGGSSGMLNGFARGVADAQVAIQQIAAAGLPVDSIVYATADFDVSSAQFPACDAYLQGFTSVLGTVARQGIYGGLHYLNHAHAAGLAVGFWQAGATSWNHGESPQMPINFEQTTNTPPVAGTDHNFIYNFTTTAGGNATPLPKPEGFDMPQNWNINGTIATVGESFGHVWTDPGNFSYLTNMGAWGAPVAKSLTSDQLTTIIAECNARGAAYSAVGGPGVVVPTGATVDPAVIKQMLADSDAKILAAIAAAKTDVEAHIPTKLTP